MRSFTEYLTESKKTYEFKIKVAGELPEDFSSALKTAMEKYSVVKLSSGKRTPIQETPLDFPNLKNVNVTVFDFECNYPTTPQVLEAYISQVCGCSEGKVIVKTANQCAEDYTNEEKTEQVLDEPETATEDGQGLVGEKHISSFLKDLASEAKARNQPTEKANPMPEPGASISPIGSKAQKGK